MPSHAVEGDRESSIDSEYLLTNYLAGRKPARFYFPFTPSAAPLGKRLG
jgi:hypothetical protein